MEPLPKALPKDVPEKTLDDLPVLVFLASLKQTLVLPLPYLLIQGPLLYRVQLLFLLWHLLMTYLGSLCKRTYKTVINRLQFQLK